MYKKALIPADGSPPSAAAIAQGVALAKSTGGTQMGGIIDTTKTVRCDLVVMPSHGRKGASALILGSEPVKVLPPGKISVLICR